MILLAAVLWMGSHQAVAADTAAETSSEVVSEPEVSEQGRQELQNLLETEAPVEVEPGMLDRRPAVLGAATTEPTEHPELDLNYTDSVPETSVESTDQR